MPIAELPNRIVKFSGESLPIFPSVVSITAELGPKELFGTAPLTGRLPLKVPGDRVMMEADLSHGGIKYPSKSKSKLPHLHQHTVLFDLPIEFDGHNATVNTVLNSDSAFRSCITLMADQLPTFVSLALGAPVEFVDIFGTVGSSSFVVEVQGAYHSKFSVLPVGDAIDTQLRSLVGLPVEAASRVFAALRYFNQERLLAYQAVHPTQFLAERLLNISKACEVLFSSNVDLLRTALSDLNVKKTISDTLVSAMYVRNQVDVGHVRLNRLTSQELVDFQRLVIEAGSALEYVIRHTIQEVAAERYHLRETGGAIDSKAMKGVAKVLAAIDKEHWSIVHDASWIKGLGDGKKSP
jgi:hypothetical protein